MESDSIDFFNKTKKLSQLLANYKPAEEIKLNELVLELTQYLSLKLKSKETIKWRYYLLILYNGHICRAFTELKQSQKENLSQQIQNVLSSSSSNNDTLCETKEIKDKYASIINYEIIERNNSIQQQIPIKRNNIITPVGGKMIDKSKEKEKEERVSSYNEPVFGDSDFVFNTFSQSKNNNKLFEENISSYSSFKHNPYNQQSNYTNSIETQNQCSNRDSIVKQEEMKINQPKTCLFNDIELTNSQNAIIERVLANDSRTYKQKQVNTDWVSNAIKELNQAKIQPKEQYCNNNNNNSNTNSNTYNSNNSNSTNKKLYTNNPTIEPYPTSNFQFNPNHLNQNTTNIIAEPPVKQNQYRELLIHQPGKETNANLMINKEERQNAIKQEKKVDNLYIEIQQYNSLIAFIHNKLKQNTIPLFNLLDGLTKSISVETKLKVITLESYFFPFYNNNQKTNKLKEIENLCPELPELDLLKGNILFKKDRGQNEIANLMKAFVFDEGNIDQEIITRLSSPKKTIEDFIELYQLLLYDRYVLSNPSKELVLMKVAFILYYIIEYLVAYLDGNTRTSLITNMHILLAHFKSYNKRLELMLELDEKQKEFKYNGVHMKHYHESRMMFDNDLFAAKDIQSSQDIIRRLGKFFSLNELHQRFSILNNANFNYIMYQIELYYNKKTIIDANLKKYKQNLVKLEKQLYAKAQEEYGQNRSQQTVFESYKMSKESKDVFDELRYKLKNKFNEYSFELFPIGSVTQLLGTNKSDIDIFLDISGIKNTNYKIKFLYDLSSFLKDFCVPKTIISKRLCVISFTFKKRKIDLSCLAICPYLHSHLIRTYAMIDARFAILAINIKHLTSLLKIKNDTNLIYLNSFSWMFLLITFLQDVVSPPVLPKLISKTRSKTYSIQIRSDNNRFKPNSFNEFFNDKIREENITVPFTYDYPDYQEIYKNSIEKNGKNNMSLAELFLNFLEFIAFDFKYDTLFVNNSIYGECVMNMSKINHSEDNKFRYYYRNKFKSEKDKGKTILIREPFDGSYNPAQTLLNTESFLSVLREAYSKLLQSGNFDSLIPDNE